MSRIQAVLFDLDGTLLDTAPDLLFALNLICESYGKPPLSLASIRPIANLGSKAMLKLAFNIEETDPLFNTLRERFLSLYEKHIANATQFFPHIEKVLSYLEERDIPWGVVTNKLTLHATQLLNTMQLSQRMSCLICGDTYARSKPDPLPLVQACGLLQIKPKDCVYIGDAVTDVIASKAAETKSLVALYGYINEAEDPYTWQADGYIHEPIEIIDWLQEYQPNLPK